MNTILITGIVINRPYCGYMSKEQVPYSIFDIRCNHGFTDNDSDTYHINIIGSETGYIKAHLVPGDTVEIHGHLSYQPYHNGHRMYIHSRHLQVIKYK